MGDGEFDEEVLGILGAIRADVAEGNIKLGSIETKVNELDRTIRGSNGNRGLVTEVAVLQSQIADHVGEDSHADAKIKADKDPGKYITWNWFVDKGVMPVVIASLIWFLLTVLPNLLTMAASVGD
ncbi:hypothetical protein KAR91_64765 [Candidatus Pacearchaeota archaeon]|nr:hypothetical protein [Candidatus Pacearchaeota archaeon]